MAFDPAADPPQNYLEPSDTSISRQLGYSPNALYSWRVSYLTALIWEISSLTLFKPPSPPHINIPPLREDRDLALPPYDGSIVEADFGDDKSRQIIRFVASQGRIAATSNDWKYESRRQAQAITPFLYLGPSSAAKNIAALKEEGITMLLVIRDMRSAASGFLSGKKVADQLGISHATVDVDGNAQLMHTGFSKAIKIINNHLVSKHQEHTGSQTFSSLCPFGKPNIGGKILVFCESGNERSAAVVAAYLITMYDLGLVEAIQFVQAHRFCVAYDDGLKHLLMNYRDILLARKSVLATRNLSALDPKVKRTRDEVDDDESMDLDDADDEARFRSRKGFIPFHG